MRAKKCYLVLMKEGERIHLVLLTGGGGEKGPYHKKGVCIEGCEEGGSSSSFRFAWKAKPFRLLMGEGFAGWGASSSLRRRTMTSPLGGESAIDGEGKIPV